MKNIKNSIYGVIDALIFPVLMLLATPILITSLGVEGYATWILVNSVVASLAVFNLGGGDVVVKFVSSIRGGGGINTTEEVFGTVFIFQSFFVLVIYLLFLVIAPFAIQYTASENLLTFVNILYFAIPMFFIKQAEGLLYSFLSGYEQFGRSTAVSSVSGVIFLVTQITIAVLTQSVKNVFIGALIVSIVLFIFQAVYIKSIHKDSISFNKASINTVKSLLSFGVWNWLSSLTFIPKGHSDKWIVSWLLGLQTFGIYSIGVLVFNQLHTIVGSSISWIFPNISRQRSSEKSLVRKYWKLVFYVGALSLIISVVLINLNFLFEFWLGEEIYHRSQYYINTFLLLFPFFTMNIVHHVYLLGLGLARPKFFAELISLVAKVVTVWLVIDIFNIEEWILFFMVFIAVEYVAYSVVISKNLPIKFAHLIVFLLLQALIVLVRI